MANSSYLEYLPPALWIPDNDPGQMLGRHLRIYEKILTGLSADGTVVRAAAPFVTAQLNAIVLVNEADAARFAVGDWITIEGAAERRQIQRFAGATIILDANLVGIYVGGTMRIADLVAGQTTFRADNVSRLDPGYPLRTLQAGAGEDLLVGPASGPFVTLQFPLTKTYLMASNAVPVKLIDSLTQRRGPRVYADLETQIDQLVQTFNPWRVRADFLPWLASWVALTLRPEWTEYQKRKLIAEMAGIYQQRGLKAGIYTYLDIYAVAAARPRVVVDDGEAIFHPRFAEDGTALLWAFAHSNTASPVSDPTKTITVLLHPTGVAVDTTNQYFVCDPGDVSLTVPRQPALWRVTPTGEVDYGLSQLPMPMPIPIHSGNPFHLPCAVTVDKTDRVAVLDSGSIISATQQVGAIYRFAPPAYTTLSTVIDKSTTPPFPAVHPVDMALNAAGNFVVLDRGRHPLGSPPAGPSNSRIVVVSEGPLAVATHPLPTVKEPTAILADPLGPFLIADARDQYSTIPADIVLVDPAAGWTTKPLLSAEITAFSIASNIVTLIAKNDFVAGESVTLGGLSSATYLDGQTFSVLAVGLSSTQFQISFTHANVGVTADTGFATLAGNPLVFPTGMVWESPNVLLVCDLGVRNGYSVDPGNRMMAEPPHIFRVKLAAMPPVIERVTTHPQLVHPTKLAWDRKRRLLITDRGEKMDDSPQRNWRAGSNEFGVSVLFSTQRPTTVAERNQFRRGIVRIIDSEVVAHTSWSMDF